MTKTNKSSSSSTITATANTTSTSTSACAACKYQRRRCAPDCILAPHFPSNNPHQFLNVHRLFGVSNVLKILKNVEPGLHKQAMSSIIFHSNLRARDPVLGCYRLIAELKCQIDHYSQVLQLVRNQIDLYKPQKNDATTDVSSCCDANFTQAATSVDDYGNIPIMQQLQQQQQHQPQQQYYNSLLYDLQENQDSNHNLIAGGNDNNDLSDELGFNVNLDNLGNESLEMEMIGERQEEAMKPSVDMFDMENAFEYGDNSKDLTVASSFIALDGWGEVIASGVRTLTTSGRRTRYNTRSYCIGVSRPLSGCNNVSLKGGVFPVDVNVFRDNKAVYLATNIFSEAQEKFQGLNGIHTS